jgi:hypothetical protein
MAAERVLVTAFLNVENWGLVNEDLPETVVSGTRTI